MVPVSTQRIDCVVPRRQQMHFRRVKPAGQDEDHRMRLVVISDTHGLHDSIGSLPEGDVLVHAGDFMNSGFDLETIASFNRWLRDQPFKHRVVCAGNHDRSFECMSEVARSFLHAATAPRQSSSSSVSRRPRAERRTNASYRFESSYPRICPRPRKSSPFAVMVAGSEAIVLCRKLWANAGEARL